MRKFFFALVCLFLMSNLEAETYQDRVDRLAAQWRADGLDIRSGIDADGVQNLAVLAAGGYYPLTLKAKAGVKNVLRVYTDKSYDCSRAFTLPDYGIRLILPPKGVKEIPLPPLTKGSTLYGVCSMGMYNFTIQFE